MSIIRFSSPECVMVRIRKAGSTSVVRGLFGGIENGSVLPSGPFPAEWRRIYSFAFIRNPFDRLVSAFLMFQGYAVANDAEKAFRAELTLERVMDVVEDPSISPDGDNYFSRLKQHALPMTTPIFCLHDVNDIYRFEDFDAEYRRLARRLGVECGEVPHLRKSQRQPYPAYFSNRDRHRAESLFHEDLREFGYAFGKSRRWRLRIPACLASPAAIPESTSAAHRLQFAAFVPSPPQSGGKG